MTTALVVLVPEAEPFVAPYRAQYDPVAAIGVPAHVTLIHPFIDDPLAPKQLDALRRLFEVQPAFAYRLTRVARFAATVYLEPDPAAPFRALVRALVDRFGIKPYEGKHWPEITPHLTVGDKLDPATLGRLEIELSSMASVRLPLTCTTNEVALLANRDGRWRLQQSFGLGGSLQAVEIESS